MVIALVVIASASAEIRTEVQSINGQRLEPVLVRFVRITPPDVITKYGSLRHWLLRSFPATSIIMLNAHHEFHWGIQSAVVNLFHWRRSCLWTVLCNMALLIADEAWPLPGLGLWLWTFRR